MSLYVKTIISITQNVVYPQVLFIPWQKN